MAMQNRTEERFKDALICGIFAMLNKIGDFDLDVYVISTIVQSWKDADYSGNPEEWSQRLAETLRQLANELES